MTTLPCLFSRRGFIGAMGAGIVTACHPGVSKKLHIVCSSAAGAASDNLVRLFARHLARFGIAATVENLSRGGGRLAAQAIQRGPTDGSVVGMLQTALIFNQLLDKGELPWDLASMPWLGSLCIDRRALVVTGRSGVQRFEDLLTRPRPLIVVASSAAGPGVYESAILRHLTGARLQIVPGYAGGARMLALISGEAEGSVTALDSVASVLEMPGTRILLRINDMPLPPGLPPSVGVDVPAMRDVARPGPDREPLLALSEAHNRLGRIMTLPPGTPTPIVAEWRALFARVMADAAFRKDAARQHVMIEYTSGPEVEAQLTDILRTRRSHVQAALRRALVNWAD